MPYFTVTFDNGDTSVINGNSPEDAGDIAAARALSLHKNFGFPYRNVVSVEEYHGFDTVPADSPIDIPLF